MFIRSIIYGKKSKSKKEFHPDFDNLEDINIHPILWLINKVAHCKNKAEFKDFSDFLRSSRTVFFFKVERDCSERVVLSLETLLTYKKISKSLVCYKNTKKKNSSMIFQD